MRNPHRLVAVRRETQQRLTTMTPLSTKNNQQAQRNARQMTFLFVRLCMTLRSPKWYQPPTVKGRIHPDFPGRRYRAFRYARDNRLIKPFQFDNRIINCAEFSFIFHDTQVVRLSLSNDDTVSGRHTLNVVCNTYFKATRYNEPCSTEAFLSNAFLLRANRGIVITN